MKSFNTNGHDFRILSVRRMYFSSTLYLVFVLLMSQASCWPLETNNENGRDAALISSDKDYIDPDEIEWKDFAAVKITPKAHPIIFYNEDTGNEYYDPRKYNKKSVGHREVNHFFNQTKPLHGHKNKEISRHHRHRSQTKSDEYMKPGTVDINTYSVDHQKAYKSRNHETYEPKEENIHFKIMNALNEENTKVKSDPTTKEEKTIKYIHRYPRDITFEDEHVTKSVRHKRNPYYRTMHNVNQLSNYGLFSPAQSVYFVVEKSDFAKHPVKSTYYHNAYSPSGGRNRKQNSSMPLPDVITRFDDSDRPVWPLDMATRKPPAITLPPRRLPPPIVHFGDEEFVTSAPDSQITNRNLKPAVPAREEVTAQTLPPRRTAPPIVQYGDEDFVAGNQNHISRPTVAPAAAQSGSAFRPTTRLPTTTTTTTTARPQISRGISSCIWAISSCCNNSGKIRYECFERLGCDGAFWGLNPCADEIFNRAVQATDEYLE